MAGAAPGGVDDGALFWGRARWAVPDYELCFYLKGLGGVYEVTLCGVILALFRADPGHFTRWSRGRLTHRHRCPLTGDGGVGKRPGIREGPRSRPTPPSHLFRSPRRLCADGGTPVFEHFRAIFLLVSAEEELKCFRK